MASQDPFKDDPFEFLSEEPEGSKGLDPNDPVDRAISETRRAAQERQSEFEDDPFDFLATTSEQQLGAPKEFTAGRAFQEGVEKGLLEPLSLFGIEAETPEQVEGSVAETLGHLTGMGISFVPYYGAARVGIKGVGLLKGMQRLGASARTARLAQEAAVGAVSGSVFEAGTAETREEAVRRGLIGGAAGFVADPLIETGFMRGVLPKIRKARQASKESAENLLREEAGRTVRDATELQMSPAQLSIERSLHPEKLLDPDQYGYATRRLVEPESDLDEILGRMSAVFQPGGQAIVPGIQNPERTIPILRRLMPESTQFVTRRADDGTFEMGIIDSRPTPRLVAEIRQMKDRSKTIEKWEERFLGEEGVRPFEFEEAAELLDEVADVYTGTQAELGQIAQNWTPGAQYGRWQPRFLSEELSEIYVDNESFKRYETLVHEFTHEIFGRRAWERTGSLSQVVKYDFREVIDDLSGEEALRVYQEMQQSSEEILTDIFIKQHSLGEKAAREEAKSLMSDASDYWFSHPELLARQAELMFKDPALAREVAPNATRVVADVIQEDSPRLTRILSRKHKVIHEEIVREFGDPTKVFDEVPIQLTDDMRKTFKEDGLFPGFEVIDEQGASWEYVRKMDKTRLKQRGKKRTGQALHVLRDPISGDIKRVTRDQFMRPNLPDVLAKNGRITARISEILDEGLGRHAPVVLEDPGTRNAVQGYVDLRNFARTTNLDNWVRQNRPQAGTGVGGRRPRGGDFDDQEVALIAKRLGHDGVVVADNGTYDLILASDDALMLQDGAVPLGAVKGLDGVVGQRRIQLSFESAVSGMLREHGGVPEKLIPHYVRQAKQEYGLRLQDLMEREFFEMAQSAKEATNEGVLTGIDALAKAVNLTVERTEDGLVRLVHNENKDVVAKGLTEDEARQFIIKSGTESKIPLAGQQQIPDETVASSSGSWRPPKFQERTGRRGSEELAEDGGMSFTDLAEGSQILGSGLTAMENLSKLFERRLNVPAWSKVFKPGQEAIRKVEREIGRVAREMLGGETYQTFLKKNIVRPAARLSDDRKEKVVDYIEFMTKEEVERTVTVGEAGRAMTDEEIALARRFDALNVADDLPRLQAVNRLTDRLLENQQQFIRRVDNMERTELSDEFAEALENLRQQAENGPQSRDEVLEALGLNSQEREAIDLINQYQGTDPDDLSLFAVGRHAAAPELPAEYSSGREWFADIHNMTDEEIEIAENMDRLFQQVFEESGLDPQRQLAGYFPHMRKYTEAGFTTEEEFIRQAFPDMDWVHNRMRTGELDIYSKDPGEVAYKYVRGLMMNRHFDPALKTMKEGLDEIDQVEHRVYRIMSEYVEELSGRPHRSFTKVEESIRSTARAMGFDPGKGFVKKLVNTLTGLTYGATIPFRPALILRNYYQALQMIAPRVGMRDFITGTRRAMADRGFEAARKGGAIPENVRPVHASTEVFDNVTQGLNLGERLDALVNKGFDWYQDADQFGRSIAYHAQQARFEKHMDDFMKGDVTWETFKKRTKLSTYDEIDQQEFRRLIEAGNVEQAKDHIASTLARETIFRYGHANHPAGWGSIYGRLFGQFGTWPVQYKDFMVQGLTRGTAKDKAEFLAMHGATNLATLAAGSAVGMDLMSWVTFPSLQYTGGPYADIAMDMATVVGGSESERSMALQNLKYQLPTLENPQTIFVPLSYSVGDFVEGIRTGGGQGAFEAFGFNFTKPGEKSPIERLFEPIQ